MPEGMSASSEPEVRMSAVKLDRDGNVVEAIEFTNVEAEVSPGFLEQLKRAAKEGWQEGKANAKGSE
jgi:hypothetical protein